MTKRMIKSERHTRRKKMMEQRLIGLGLLACCVLALWVCSKGTTPVDRDATAVVLLAPLALYMLFTKDLVIY